MNSKIKYIILIVFTFLAANSTAQVMTEMVNAELQQVDVASSSVTVNGKRYKYQINKKDSLYRDTDIKANSLRSLIKGRHYYFEIQQDFAGKSANSNKQQIIVFISEEKLPE